MIVGRKIPIFNQLFFKVSSNHFGYRQYFANFSLLLSKKFRQSLNIVSTSCDLKRKYMDLPSVIRILESEVPNYLSEKWDNTGLLTEPSKSKTVSTIFFTNDLTEDVLDEAISLKTDVILSYHPPIFSPIKSLKMSNWKDRIIIKCIENSIAIYSPHTSCDAVAGGVNDWLIKCFDLSELYPVHPSFEHLMKYSYIIDCSLCSDKNICQMLSSVPDSELCGISTVFDKKNIRIKVSKTSLSLVLKLLTDTESTASISVTPLEPLPIPSCGMGRKGKLVKPLTLGECVKLVKQYLKLEFIRFSQGVSHSLESPISTVAVCAGSGASVLKGVQADLYITGEMSHHDLLDANHRNVSVLLCEHSNSERGYLSHLAEKLRPKLPGINLTISLSDKDPVQII